MIFTSSGAMGWEASPAKNIKGVDTTYVGTINTYEVLSHTKCIILKDAVTKLEEVYA